MQRTDNSLFTRKQECYLYYTARKCNKKLDKCPPEGRPTIQKTDLYTKAAGPRRIY